MLHLTSRYALRAMILLAREPQGRPVLARQMADELDVPYNYLSKILNQLARKGLLRSFRGARGGFILARPPSRIRLFEIVEPFEDLLRYSECLLGNPECVDEGSCFIHERWKPVASAYKAFLEETTLQEVREGRPLALPREV